MGVLNDNNYDFEEGSLERYVLYKKTLAKVRPATKSELEELKKRVEALEKRNEKLKQDKL